MSSGDEVFHPRPKRLGTRALAAIGAVLCLIVGGIIVSVFRASNAKAPAPVVREDPERPTKPRFLEQRPEAAESFTAVSNKRRTAKSTGRSLHGSLPAPVPERVSAGFSSRRSTLKLALI